MELHRLRAGCADIVVAPLFESFRRLCASQFELRPSEARRVRVLLRRAAICFLQEETSSEELQALQHLASAKPGLLESYLCTVFSGIDDAPLIEALLDSCEDAYGTRQPNPDKVLAAFERNGGYANDPVWTCRVPPSDSHEGEQQPVSEPLATAQSSSGDPELERALLADIAAPAAWDMLERHCGELLGLGHEAKRQLAEKLKRRVSVACQERLPREGTAAIAALECAHPNLVPRLFGAVIDALDDETVNDELTRLFLREAAAWQVVENDASDPELELSAPSDLDEPDGAPEESWLDFPEF